MASSDDSGISISTGSHADGAGASDSASESGSTTSDTSSYSSVEIEMDEQFTYCEYGGDPSRMTSHIQREVNRMNLPDGPKALPELFHWPRYNAQKLLLESPESNMLRSNFQELLKYDIEIHDNYSGTGTGSVTLHLQHKHMMSVLQQVSGVPPDCGKVKSITASDCDTNCKKVLASLNQEFRPLHIMGALEERVKESVIANCVGARRRCLHQLEILAATSMDSLGQGGLDRRKSEAGLELFGTYMKLLSAEDAFKPFAKCYGCGSLRNPKDCMSPYSYFAASRDPSKQRRSIRCSLAGSVCIDYSLIGSGAGLLGESAIPLAVWMAERLISLEDYILRECAPRFLVQLFHTYLVHEYEVHSIRSMDKQDKVLFLSPHHVGWPEHRPRLYTCLTRKATCFLKGPGLQVIFEIRRRPVISVEELYCAPQEMIEEERRQAAHKLCKPLASSFDQLLGGAKRTWLEGYRKLKKVQQHQMKAKRSGTSCAMVANLQQNPGRRPVCASWLPALLKSGTMYLLHVHNLKENCKEERWMLDVEHLHAQGIPQFEAHSLPGDPFPWFGFNAPSTVKKRLAGNAMHAGVVGAMHAAILCTLSLR